MSDLELENPVCDVCDGSWQGVNEQNGELKCYHCSEAPKHLHAVKIMKADLDSYITEMAKLKELIEFQRKKLNQCAAIIYKHHPDLHDEIRAELKIYETAK